MRKNSRILFACVLVFVLALNIAALGADNNIGNWKLNLAKSKFSPGPPPKSETLKIEAWGTDGFKFTSDGVGADGKPTHTEYSAKYDGKDYPTGSPENTSNYKRIDANNFEAVSKVKGKVTTSIKIVISKDGKTTTLTYTGKDEQGREVSDVVVFDRQ